MNQHILFAAVEHYGTLRRDLKPLADSMGLEDIQIIVGTAQQPGEDWTFRSIAMVEVLPEGIDRSANWAFTGVMQEDGDERSVPKLVTVYLDPEDITHVAFEDFDIDRNEPEDPPETPEIDVLVS